MEGRERTQEAALIYVGNFPASLMRRGRALAGAGQVSRYTSRAAGSVM